MSFLYLLFTLFNLKLQVKMQHKSQLIKTKLHFPNEEADLCKFTGWLLTISID